MISYLLMYILLFLFIIFWFSPEGMGWRNVFLIILCKIFLIFNLFLFFIKLFYLENYLSLLYQYELCI